MKTLRPSDRTVLVLLAPIVVLAIARILPFDEPFPLVAAEAVIAWALAPAWLALAYAAIRRSAIVAATAALPAIVHAWLLVGASIGGEAVAAPVDGTPLRLVTSNVLAFNEHPEDLSRELAGLEADVMVITELTPAWLVALEDAGVIARFPHRIVVPRDDCFGIALLSRFPLVSERVIDLGDVPALLAELDLGERSVSVLAVHTLPPRNAEYTEVWRAQMRALGDIVDGIDGLVVAGDLNATPFSRSYRALLAHGLRDAHAVAGRGLATTWPNGLMSVPPIRLDHVLVSPGVGVRAVREGEGAGSDHRPVIADLTVPS